MIHSIADRDSNYSESSDANMNKKKAFSELDRKISATESVYKFYNEPQQTASVKSQWNYKLSGGKYKINTSLEPLGKYAFCIFTHLFFVLLNNCY